ncbi:MAG: hypothetical protein IT207_06365 [Fimbriimonadaceae bacterium]|nr:hypothetical protein [Fimbriimonadaceae bacterium]
MKLNLLPTSISKEGQHKAAIFGSAALALLGIAAAVGMTLYGKQQLKAATDEAAAWKPLADRALATSQKADEVMAKSVYIDRNLKLAKAMQEHSAVYPGLYDEVLRYMPSWFRVNSITARPVDATTCNVQITGTLQKAEQYSDIMLALLQIPGAVNVSRNGFVEGRMFVPNLIESDQLGLPIRPGDSNLPSDPYDRHEERIARAAAEPQGFLDSGGFGRPEVDDRGAMPGWSLVGLAVTLQRNIQVPDPRATLVAQGAAAQPQAAAGSTPGSSTPAGTGQVRSTGQDDE